MRDTLRLVQLLPNRNRIVAVFATRHGLNTGFLTEVPECSGYPLKAKKADRDKMIVVFSTYQSIQTISDAQQVHGLPDFDLIICDEAHRTTGATLAGEDESNFVRIHSNDHVAGKKRLYMTATPKVFGDNAKTKAKIHAVELASMDDDPAP